jgi:hypothetical protein
VTSGRETQRSRDESATPGSHPSGDQPRPDFGPSGYLPERAAQRARKIILRSPLGLQWVLGAVAVGLVVVVAAVFYLLRDPAPPTDDYTAVAPLTEVGDEQLLEGRDALIVTAPGRVRTFAVDPDDLPSYCEASRRLESPSGRVWAPTGRGLDGGPSLAEHSTIVVEGVVYVDLGRTLPSPPPEETGAEPACS